MKNILIILGILIGVNFIIVGICKAFADGFGISMSSGVVISQLK